MLTTLMFWLGSESKGSGIRVARSRQGGLSRPFRRSSIYAPNYAGLFMPQTLRCPPSLPSRRPSMRGLRARSATTFDKQDSRRSSSQLHPETRKLSATGSFYQKRNDVTSTTEVHKKRVASPEFNRFRICAPLDGIRPSDTRKEFGDTRQVKQQRSKLDGDRHESTSFMDSAPPNLQQTESFQHDVHAATSSRAVLSMNWCSDCNRHSDWTDEGPDPAVAEATATPSWVHRYSSQKCSLLNCMNTSSLEPSIPTTVERTTSSADRSFAETVVDGDSHFFSETHHDSKSDNTSYSASLDDLGGTSTQQVRGQQETFPASTIQPLSRAHNCKLASVAESIRHNNSTHQKLSTVHQTSMSLDTTPVESLQNSWIVSGESQLTSDGNEEELSQSTVRAKGNYELVSPTFGFAENGAYTAKGLNKCDRYFTQLSATESYGASSNFSLDDENFLHNPPFIQPNRCTNLVQCSPPKPFGSPVHCLRVDSSLTEMSSNALPQRQQSVPLIPFPISPVSEVRDVVVSHRSDRVSHPLVSPTARVFSSILRRKQLDRSSDRTNYFQCRTTTPVAVLVSPRNFPKIAGIISRSTSPRSSQSPSSASRQHAKCRFLHGRVPKLDKKRQAIANVCFFTGSFLSAATYPLWFSVLWLFWSFLPVAWDSNWCRCPKLGSWLVEVFIASNDRFLYKDC